ncbi:RNA polymerase sigma factor [Sphingobacterium spiritivorum]|uniref:RNA polymerase sigma factor n=1 Tax=Sphingobacterium spiritivorum TaxID=258 RepID=UPI001918119E|nr:RNA polymerase sigma factor [Sphingobacterium spiritivorum]QQT26461.1 RNA polymerase sigma factor [Sphingobacterium spiritivorum]
MKERESEFLTLIEKNKGIIYKVARMYMDDPDDRSDLSQEIIFQLWKSFDSFKNASQFSTWMYKVAINTALVYFKKDKRKQDRIPLETYHDIADEQDHEQKEEQLAIFYKAVQELNQVEKALIFLFLEGQSHRDIADNLGISEVNARVKLNRTKEKIQQIIKKYEYEF